MHFRLDHRQDIRAVIADIDTPLGDGPATIREIQKIDPGVKIIAVSGLIQGHFDAEVTATVGTQYLRKPCMAEQLLSDLHQVLNAEPNGE